MIDIVTGKDSTFIFKQAHFDTANGVLTLNYQDSRFGDFQEQFVFPASLLQQPWLSDEQRNAWVIAVNRAVQHVFWMVGVSYYKTNLAKTMAFEHDLPGNNEARWLTDTWQAGLAELAHENELGWLSHIQFPAQAKKSTPQSLSLPGRTLVPIGGGKDSLVTIERLRHAGEDISLIQVGSSALIQQVADATGLPLIQIKRRVDARLKVVAEQGAYNGHVPITAINSTVAVLTALLGGFDSIAFSNERSADVGNVQADNGQWVNHQYSKSWAFEQQYREVLRENLGQGPDYFSVLRPYSELAIVQQFSHYPQYFEVFSSCNRNFHLTGSKNKDRHWCGVCPKCAFVFVTLAPFISRQQLLAVFGHDLLADKELKDLFLALFGIKGDKPFECVGEALEMRAALALLQSQGDWQKQDSLKYWAQTVPTVSKTDIEALMVKQQPYYLPDKQRFSAVHWS
ncbi:MAG: endonuclease domain-containing protein [Proteobacteria bacterium]|nr:MAG: endonuclease domain-containing protein [Pseudomonadota bacterium]